MRRFLLFLEAIYFTVFYFSLDFQITKRSADAPSGARFRVLAPLDLKCQKNPPKFLFCAAVTAFAFGVRQTNKGFSVFVGFRAKLVSLALQNVIAFFIGRGRTAICVAPEIFARNERDV